MERCIREILSAQPSSELRLSSTIISIEETKDNVIVTYSTSTGEEKQLRAKFLVGADGKTGFTRKKYLESRGVTMEKDEKYVEVHKCARSNRANGRA
jgi:2-polyprenyl-6-methoxyphenol hydroxylase-like FAD-dependent oxidoreductase